MVAEELLRDLILVASDQDQEAPVTWGALLAQLERVERWESIKDGKGLA